MKLLFALMALFITGCCSVRWPSQDGLTPSKAYARYVAEALRDGNNRCAKATDDETELKRCSLVFSEVKPLLLRLEETP